MTRRGSFRDKRGKGVDVSAGDKQQDTYYIQDPGYKAWGGENRVKPRAPGKGGSPSTKLF